MDHARYDRCGHKARVGDFAILHKRSGIHRRAGIVPENAVDRTAAGQAASRTAFVHVDSPAGSHVMRDEATFKRGLVRPAAAVGFVVDIGRISHQCAVAHTAATIADIAGDQRRVDEFGSVNAAPGRNILAFYLQLLRPVGHHRASDDRAAVDRTSVPRRDVAVKKRIGDRTFTRSPSACGSSRVAPEFAPFNDAFPVRTGHNATIWSLVVVKVRIDDPTAGDKAHAGIRGFGDIVREHAAVKRSAVATHRLRSLSVVAVKNGIVHSPITIIEKPCDSTSAQRSLVAGEMAVRHARAVGNEENRAPGTIVVFGNVCVRSTPSHDRNVMQRRSRRRQIEYSIIRILRLDYDILRFAGLSHQLEVFLVQDQQ